MSLSGASWVAQYPTSTDTTTLTGDFRTNADSFIAALRTAGATVVISATFRPLERAHLMHYSYRVGHGGLPPASVPAYPGIDIQWVHTNSLGQPDPAASRDAARAMVLAYEITYAPALTTRHTDGLAVDMTISWTGDLTIANADGTTTTITSVPRSGQNTELHAVGATYNVIKLVPDRPHWSSDGH